MFQFSFEGKTALVTGGSRGIGAAISKLLLDQGATVIVLGQNAQSPEWLKSEQKGSYLSVQLADTKATEVAAQSLAKQSVDIVINNAGINKISPFSELNPEDFDRIQAVNVRAPMILCRYLIPEMAKRQYGRVLNITSIFGHVTKAGRSSYTTSKFALDGLTKTMSIEFANQNVLVNALAPGFINTDLTRSILSEDQRREMAAMTPIGRLGEPEEIAKVALFLVSDQNTYLTGQNILVDGGYTVV